MDMHRFTFEGGSILQFQEGPIKETGVNGAQAPDVLNAIVEYLREASRNSPTQETSIAITKIEEAVLWLDKRTRDREARGVEGTSAV